ncbi:hypothetical protein [Methylophaga sp. OBS4]|uniref:hypothetical protein n=1 Tax=Methylophaga sp. OBS4 TaxID=2991935 RepID=UPI00225BA18A|nr:hypothetical protein [Methylophaga sp. OBS4]MCX4186512.1 hypothetical protein [Methylophaga sp. OBS4]
MLEKESKKKQPSYLFDHFDFGVMMSDLRFSRKARRTDRIDTGKEVRLAGGGTTTLRQLASNLPLMLVTGSLSCPMTVSALPFLRELYAASGQQFAFALVYVREAHPGESYPQAKQQDEKRANAERFRDFYQLDMPVIVDDIDGSLHRTLDTKPNSLHIISADGDILFQSLWSGDFDAVRQALIDIAAGRPPQRTVSQKMLMPFLRGAGYMHQTLNLAGKRAYRELLLGAPPIWLLSRIAGALSMVSQSKRGLVAMAIMIFIALLIVLPIVL